jgi:hypothetical protein
MTGIKIMAFAPLAMTLSLPDNPEKWGVVTLLVIGIVFLWRNETARNKAHEKLIRDTAIASTMLASAIDRQTIVNVEVKDAMTKCAAAREVWNGSDRRNHK